MSYSASFDLSPLHVVNGRLFTIHASRHISGALDTLYTGSIVLSKVTGSGTVNGTTTLNAVNGAATFSLSISGSGVHGFLATLATGQTKESEAVSVRKVPYSFTAGYDTVVGFRTTILNEIQHYELMVPGHATASVPIGVMFYGSQAGYTNHQSPTGGRLQGPIRLRDNLPWGQSIDSNKSTFPFLSVSYPIEQNLDDPRGAWRHGFSDILNQLEAIGYNIDRTNVHYTGYSTGGIELFQVLALNPNLFAGMSGIDGNILGINMTDFGRGPNLYGGITGSVYEVTDPLYADVVFIPYFANWLLTETNTAIYYNKGTQNNGPGEVAPGFFYARDITDATPYWNAMNSISSGSALTITGSITNSLRASESYNRFIFEHWNGQSNQHDVMAVRRYSGSAFDGLVGWHNRQRLTSLPSQSRAKGRGRFVMIGGALTRIREYL